MGGKWVLLTRPVSRSSYLPNAGATGDTLPCQLPQANSIPAAARVSSMFVTGDAGDAHASGCLQGSGEWHLTMPRGPVPFARQAF